MTLNDWIGAVLFALILLVLCVLPAHCDRDERRYVLVFYSTEIRSISADKNTRLEFPMVDGHPDWKHGRLIKPVVDVDRKAGHYEPERDK